MVHIRTKVLDDLPPALRYSAGLYDETGTKLLRNIASVEPLPAAPFQISLEAMDDKGMAIINPGAKKVQLVANSWQAVHAGIVGNTSTDFSGDGRWNCAHHITSVVVIGEWVYCVVSYAEGLSAGIYKWRVGFPNKRYRVRQKDSLTASWIATDGRYAFINGTHSVYDEGAQTNTHHSITIVVEPQPDGSDRDVMWAGSEPLYFDRPTQTYHSLTKVSSAPIPSPNGIWDQKECTSGFAANTKFIAVAREGENRVVLYNMVNEVVASWQFDRPRHVTFTPDGTQVWVSYGDNTLECYQLNADGSLGALAPMPRIAGLVDPVGVSISPDGARLVTIDGDRYNRPGSTATHKVRVWSTVTGELLRSIGSGDYATNVLVNDRKYMFINAKSFAKTMKGGAVPYVQWLSNDEIVWADMGNSRNLFYRYSTDAIYDRLAYQGYVYSCRLVSNKEEWLMIGYCRYRIDWAAVARDKSVVGNYVLEANYSAFQRPEYDDEYNRGLDITYFPNGYMYAFQQHQRPADGSAPDFYLLLVEFSETGGIRYLEDEKFPIGTNLNRDYSLVRDRGYLVNAQGELVLDGGNPIERSVGDTDQFGVPNTNHVRERQAWTTGHKASRAPIWASPVRKKVLKRVTKDDPITLGGSPGRNTYTTNGIWGFYCLNGTYNTKPGGDVTKRRTFYLGGSPIDFADPSTEEVGMNFRTMKPTLRDVYAGNFPIDRLEDSNDSWNMASYAYAAGNYLFTVALGEHWKDRQLHIVAAYIWYGLMLFQYGAANRSDDPLEEAAPFLVSNGKTGDFFPIPGTDAIAEVINDEGMQAGVLVSLIINTATIYERTYAVEVFTPTSTNIVDAHAGLPATGPVANGTANLWRSAPESESFSVKTGVLEPEAQFEGDLADVHVTLKPQLSPNLRQATVSLNLPGAARGKHEITTIARFLLQAFDDGGDHAYLETVDRNGRIVNQLNRTRNSSNGNGELRHNGVKLGERTVEQWRPLSYNRSLFKTGTDDTGTYLAYADFAKSYATGPLDPAADPLDVVAIRVRIDTPSAANREFGVNLAGTKYRSLIAAPTTPTTPSTPPPMPTYKVSKKLATVRRIGPTLVLSVANMPQLANILKFTQLTPPSSNGSNARSTYAGTFGGRKPGGTLASVVQGETYELNAGLFDGSWSLPDFVEVTTPTISSLGPLSVTAGDTLNITGTNLLWLKYVLIGGVQAAITSGGTTSTNAAVTVPITAPAGSNIPVVAITETGSAVLATLTVTSGAPVAKLAAPVVAAPTNITSQGFTISWASVPGADGYRVRVNGATLYMPGNVLSYAITGIPPTTLATADVQALDSTNTKQASDYSNVVSATTTAAQLTFTPQGSDYAFSSISEPHTTAGGVNYTRHSSFAELTVQTSGTYLDALIFSSWLDSKKLQVFVNGTWQQAVQMAPSEFATKRILLSGTSMKTVKLRICGSHREQDTGDIWCMDVQQLTSNAAITVVAPVLPTDERNATMGDSIQGDGTVSDDLLCANMRVRDSGRHLLVEQYGFRTITLSLGTPQLRQASATSLVSYVAGATKKRIRGALGTNDEGLGFNASGAASIYGLWYDAMYALDPTIEYEMELPVRKFQGSAGGQERQSMITLRNELISMAASRPWIKILHAEYWLADIELYNIDGIHPGDKAHGYMAGYKNDTYNGVPLPVAPVMRTPKLTLTFTPTTGAAGEPRTAHVQIDNDPGVTTVDLYFSNFTTGEEKIVPNGTNTQAPYDIPFIPVEANGDYFLRANKANGFFYSDHVALSVTPFTKSLEVTPQSDVAGTQRKFSGKIQGGYNVTQVKLWKDTLGGDNAAPIMTLTAPPYDFYLTPPVSRKYFLSVVAGANNVEGFTDAVQVDVV